MKSAVPALSVARYSFLSVIFPEAYPQLAPLLFDTSVSLQNSFVLESASGAVTTTSSVPLAIENVVADNVIAPMIFLITQKPLL